jgi:hypothetical protein
MTSGSWREQAAQAGGERHPALHVHLHLADAFQVILDRVLDRHHVAAAAVDA